MRFRAITQIGVNLNTEGETGDSAKVCSGDVIEQVKQVCTSVIWSAFGLD